jgi:hypothetical protein
LLFDLRSDPQEKISRSGEMPVMAGYLNSELKRIEQAMKAKAPASTLRIKPDSDVIKDMKSLGYIK